MPDRQQQYPFRSSNSRSDARAAAETLFKSPPKQPVVEVVKIGKLRRVLPALPQQTMRTKPPEQEVHEGAQKKSLPGISNKRFASILGLLRHGMSVAKVAQAYDIPAKSIWKELQSRKIRLGELRGRR